MVIISKSLLRVLVGLNVLLFHVLEVGHFDKFTSEVPNGDELTMELPSLDIS